MERVRSEEALVTSLLQTQQWLQSQQFLVDQYHIADATVAQLRTSATLDDATGDTRHAASVLTEIRQQEQRRDQLAAFIKLRSQTDTVEKALVHLIDLAAQHTLASEKLQEWRVNLASLRVRGVKTAVKPHKVVEDHVRVMESLVPMVEEKGERG